MTMSVPFVALNRQYLALKDELDATFQEIAAGGQYVMGPQVEAFERDLAALCGVPYCLTVANGTDALKLCLSALGIGPGDEVIVPVNSFIASAGAVIEVGATPKFCDVLHDFNIDPEDVANRITSATKAIIAVHLTGRPAEMQPLRKLSDRHNLFLIEDAAQAVGATYNNEPVGSLGDMAAFSLHPLKNLFVLGDGGFVTLKCRHLYEQIKKRRNHGLIDRNICGDWGINSRLDTIHCAIGLVKLKHFEKITGRFRHIANRYSTMLDSVVEVPAEQEHTREVFHNFVIKCDNRDALAEFLGQQGIETKMHYPVLLCDQPAATGLSSSGLDFPMAREINQKQLSLPIYPELTDDEIDYVISKVLEFYI